MEEDIFSAQGGNTYQNFMYLCKFKFTRPWNRL